MFVVTGEGEETPTPALLGSLTYFAAPVHSVVIIPVVGRVFETEVQPVGAIYSDTARPQVVKFACHHCISGIGPSRTVSVMHVNGICAAL